MFVAAAIVSVLLALALVGSAAGKLSKNPQQIESITKVGFPADRIPLLAAAEIAGAVGLVAGLFWWPVGVAAAVGVVAYFVGAVVMHLRAGDKAIAPAAVLLVVAAAAGVLITLSA